MAGAFPHLIVQRIHRDHRGSLSETYNEVGLRALGTQLELVQDNHSLIQEEAQ